MKRFIIRINPFGDLLFYTFFLQCRRGRRRICRHQLVDGVNGVRGRGLVALLPTNAFEMSFALAVVAEPLAKLAIRAKMLCRATGLARRQRRDRLRLASWLSSTTMQDTRHGKIAGNCGSGEMTDVGFKTLGALDDTFGRVEIGVLLFQQGLPDLHTANADDVHVAERAILRLILENGRGETAMAQFLAELRLPVCERLPRLLKASVKVMSGGHNVLLRVVMRVEEFDELVVGDGFSRQRAWSDERLEERVGGISNRPNKERFLVFGGFYATGFKVKTDAIAI